MSFYAGGFLFDKNSDSVLLHLRDDKTLANPNKWSFFGGGSEDKESPKECFIREIKEELDIDITAEQIIEICNYLNKDQGKWRYVFYIESELKKSEMTLGEGADFEWVPLDKVFKYDLTKKTADDLKTFLQLISRHNSNEKISAIN